MLALAFIAAAAVAGVIFARQGARPGEAGKHWKAVGLAFAVLAVLTAVFDSVMIGMELFHYDSSHILGLKIGLAPIEDFAYPLAGVVALPGLWMWLTRKRKGSGSSNLKGLVPPQALLASRPVSWINTAYPFAAAMLLTTREIDWILIVGTFYFLIPYNLAMYGINDVFDYESDLKNPRKGGIEGALLQPRLHRPMLWLAAITNIPFLLVLAFAGGPAVWVSLAVSAFAWWLTRSPDFASRNAPVLDSLTSSTHFVSPAVVGLALAGAEVTPGGLLILLGAFFLWGGMAAHAFGAVQDIEPDRQAGIGP